MTWRPSTGPDIARARARMKQQIRQYFDSTHTLEIDAPLMIPATVTDPNIESFRVEHGAHFSAPMYLHTSPEYAMKRMLADGYPDIYSIGPVFRDGELGRRHQPEFTMVEWYRLDHGEEQIINDTVALIESALEKTLPVRRMTYTQAFERALGINVKTADLDTIRACTDVDADFAESLGDDRDAWLDWLFAEKVSESFDTDGLTLVNRFPSSQAALAALAPEDPETALRFEMFAGSVELANGYVELCNPGELRERFEKDLEVRRRRHHPQPELDDRFLQAMRAGLPACSGVALGFDRLLMIRLGKTDIRDVVSFEFEGQL